MAKIVVLSVAGIVLLLAVIAIVLIGPRDLAGMLRYDTRHEGKLKVGDRAPDLELVGLDGSSPARLLAPRHGRPLVIVFGSFT